MTTQDAIASALIGLRPGAEWVLRGDNYADIEWLDKNQAVPTEDEVINYVPPPPPAPPEPTPAEKLAAAGLTVDDLKTLLGVK